MDEDLRILNRCAYAIFDLSDLGAQLVEMQEARQKHTSINSLLVYPVRERRNEPERGRRTVLSFGLPHFGYTTFDELKGIIWRFLADAPVERDYSPRFIHDPVLDREIRRSRLAFGRRDLRAAEQIITRVTRNERYTDSLEAWLQLALIVSRKPDRKAADSALAKADRLARTSRANRAEVLYYKVLLQAPQTTPAYEEAKGTLTRALQLKPGDCRFLQLLGFVLWKLGERDRAIDVTQMALDDRNVPDPIVSIQVLNNLGYFFGEKAIEEGLSEESSALDEALDLTKHLPSYHKVFRRRGSSWLDTRGWLLALKVETLSTKPSRRHEAQRISDEARKLLEDALGLEPQESYVKEHLDYVKGLQTKLAASRKPKRAASAGRR
jgi:tetratricopeptide (TPR) repeat protein